MKKNNKGFMLAEVFIVSSFVLGVLVYMFIQTNSIMRNFNRSFSYNTVSGLYITNEVAKYIKKNDTNNYCTGVNIIDHTDNNTWNNLKKSSNINTVIIGNLNDIKANATSYTEISPKAQDFIKFLEEKDNCVIIIEFNNKIGSIDSKQVDNYTYASLNF